MLLSGPPRRASKSIPRIHLQTMSRTSAALSGSNCSSLTRGKRRSKRLSKLLHPLRRMSQNGSLGRSPLGQSRLSASPQRSVKALRIWNVSPARPLLSLWVFGSSGASLTLPSPSCPFLRLATESHRRLSKPSSVCWRSINLTQIQCASTMDQQFHSSIDYDRKPFRRNICVCLARVHPSRDRMDNLCPELIRARVVVHLLSWRARVPGVSRFLFLMSDRVDLTSFLDSLPALTSTH